MRQPWVWILVLSSSLTLFVLFGFGFYQQIYLDIPWGTNPISDREVIVFGALAFTIGAGLPWLLYTMRLTVQVSSGALYVRYPPFIDRRIPIASIAQYQAVTYSPLRDYGGWGVRIWWGGKGWAYNVHGTRGVRLEFANGSHLLIGSQRADEFARAIESAKSSANVARGA